MPAPSPPGDREVERLRLGLRDSLADHGAYMAKLRDVEAALLAGLSTAAAARIAPLDGLPTPPSRPLEAAERRERRKRRKRNRRRRIRRGGAAADSLSDGSLTTGSDSDSDGDLELERANELGEDELLDDISEEPAPAEPRVELRAPDAEAAYQRGCALWDAGFRVPPQGSECGRGFDVYRALSALLASGSAARSELAERLGEALGVPPPYGVHVAEVATLRLVHSGLCAGAGNNRLSKLQLFALMTPSEESDGFSVPAPPPGRGRAEVEQWVDKGPKIDSHKKRRLGETAAAAVWRRLGEEVAAAVRPPTAQWLAAGEDGLPEEQAERESERQALVSQLNHLNNSSSLVIGGPRRAKHTDQMQRLKRLKARGALSDETFTLAKRQRLQNAPLRPKAEPKGQKDLRNALADRSKKKSAEKKELVSRMKSIDELLDQKPALHVPAADDVDESMRLLRRWHRGGAEGKAVKTRFRLTVQPVAGGEAAAIGEHRSGLSPCVI